ncbi:MAG TPA: SRPBCC family protein [Thermoleophilaceae bacterium]|jgi:uncharacterized protein YndB with AHSA1/START domain|nr:SRPBCC family protein [Thermoleophilaceae bacterium]
MSEVRIADVLQLDAPIEIVWSLIADPVAHARWHPFVSAIAGGHELEDLRSCTVRVGRKEGTTKERCVERDDGARIVWAIEEDSTGFGSMVSGWCSGFALAEHDGATLVTAESRFRPSNLLVRAMLPLIRRKFHRTQQSILRGLQDAVEGVPVEDFSRGG